MSAAEKPNHDYHLVDPSPWPFLGSMSALLLALGGIHYMHPTDFMPFLPEGIWLLLLGVAAVLYTMLVWWRDVVRESVYRHDHTPVVKLGLRYGVVLFIASEVMFFVAWFWAFFHVSFYPPEVIGGVWPPEGVQTFDPWHLPFINTLILLTSGTTLTWAHHALVHGDRKGLIQGLWLTVVLGTVFTVLQAYEYAHAPFTIDGGIYGSVFFLATGFHGFHVIVGTIFLAICLMRAYRGDFTPQRHFGFEAAAWYWHFVDVVWLFLFATIYVWGAGTPAPH